jgi:hypothetical protein
MNDENIKMNLFDSNDATNDDGNKWIELMNIFEDISDENISYYSDNYTLKEINLICDYYGISKSGKRNKLQTIQVLVKFESNSENKTVVSKRQLLWSYMNELKKDKFTKKLFMFK